MGELGKILVALFLVSAAIIGLSSVLNLLHGRVTLEEFFRPGWTDFAIANPLVFAVIVVFGAILIGGAFVQFLDVS